MSNDEAFVEVRPRQIEYYVTDDDVCPFKDWLYSLADPTGRIQIDKRLLKLELGNFGEWDDVGDGVIELIFKNKGPGYRIYFAQDGPTIVLLLLGGMKRGQQTDIERAKLYWRNYNQ